MLLLRAPGAYPPQDDTWLLAGALGEERCAGARVLDLCAGSGALAVAAARLGAAHVTAVDISRRAVIAAWINARCRRARVRVRRGDLLAPVSGERFDIIVANPPYVPSPDAGPPPAGRARCWDAGTDGRAVLDRICSEAPPLLAPGGMLLVVFSTLCGEEAVADRLGLAGLRTSVVARSRQPFGPVLTARADMMESRGLIQPGQRFEELVVIRGRAPG